MAKKNIDLSKQLISEVKMTAREYYNFRNLAIQNNVFFHVRWEPEHAVVTTETPFLIANGYDELLEF